MKTEVQLKIASHDFDSKLIEDLSEENYAQNYWPIVYLLSDGKDKQAYVGETTDALARMTTHLKHQDKKKLSAVHLISSDMFNKSATLDIESNLIKYLAGDGYYKLLNGNLGLANHDYYQKKEVYWDVFKSIWNRLRAEGVSKHSLEHIDNSDLFKYSPYKQLGKDQIAGLKEVILTLLTENSKAVVVQGGAGTGKTILAIFLFKLILSDLKDFNIKEFGEEESEFLELIKKLKAKFPEPKMALVIPMSSFRKTMKSVFKNIHGLKSSMVVGPTHIVDEPYDIIIVDEAHRLRRRVNLGAYYGAFDKINKRLGLDTDSSSELDWVLAQSKKQILFYDQAQSVKPSDVEQSKFNEVIRKTSTAIVKLKSQFRVKGGNAFVSFVDQLLNGRLEEDEVFQSDKYELKLYTDITAFKNKILEKEEESGLSRMIAGYAWPWISKTDKSLFDIVIDQEEFQWNGTATDWINWPNSVNEVGCIHTIQGYDLNYSGVIFGHEISYNLETMRIEIIEENYFDKNGKQSIKSPDELHAFIINIYKTVLLRGIKGTYIFVCDKNLRDYFKKHIPLADSQAKENETDRTTKEIRLFDIEDIDPFVNCIPFYPIHAAAGAFGDPMNSDEVKWIKPAIELSQINNYFACLISGQSMNRVIPDGSLCLFKKDTGGSRNGRIVLVEMFDQQDPETNSRFTVKEYSSKKIEKDGSWEHSEIRLRPNSDQEFDSILLESGLEETFRVLGVFEKVLN